MDSCWSEKYSDEIRFNGLINRHPRTLELYKIQQTLNWSQCSRFSTFPKYYIIAYYQ